MSGGRRRRRRRGRGPCVAVVAAACVLAAAAVAALALTDRLPGGAGRRADADARRPTRPARPAPVGGPGRARPRADRVRPPPAVPTRRRWTPCSPRRRSGGGAGATVIDVATGQVLLDRDAADARTPASVAKLADRRRRAGRLRARSTGSPPASCAAPPGAGRARRRRRRDADHPARRRPRGQPRRAARQPGRLGRPGRSAARRPRQAARRCRHRARSTTRCSPGRRCRPTGRRPTSAPASSARSARCRSTTAGCGPAQTPASPTRPWRPGGTWPGCCAGAASRSRRSVAAATAPGGRRRPLAAVQSPTVAELVELALQTSDNDLAEALLRLVGGAGRPARDLRRRCRARSLGCARRARRADRGAWCCCDGSGLARGSAVPPATLARLLRVAADGRAPGLAPLVDGLPVAGFSGTLALRFTTGAPRAGAGRGAGQDRHAHRGQRAGRDSPRSAAARWSSW